MDSGRFSSEVPEGVAVTVLNITFGAEEASSAVDSSFDGCLSDLVVNLQIPHLPDVLANTDGVLSSTSEGVTMGCGPGDSCTPDPCPGGSMCEEEWRDYICSCPTSFPAVINGSCVDPCQPNPCMVDAQCSPARDPAHGHTPFTCDCRDSRSGPLCEVDGCGLAMFSNPSSSCQRCQCAPQGAQGDVCDGTTGDCLCKVSV